MNGWSAQLSMALAGPAILKPHLSAIDLLCPVLITAVHCSVRSETMESFGSNRRHLAPFLLYTFPRLLLQKCCRTEYESPASSSASKSGSLGFKDLGLTFKVGGGCRPCIAYLGVESEGNNLKEK